MHAINLHLIDAHNLAILDEAHLCRRAAHIKGEHLAVSRKLAVMSRGDGSCCGPGFDDLHGECARGLRRIQSAAGLHQQEVAVEAHCIQAVSQLPQISRDDRLDVCVHRGRARSLVLLQLPQHFVRKRDEHRGRNALDNSPDGDLMIGIGKRIKQADGDRLHTLLDEACYGTFD